MIFNFENRYLTITIMLILILSCNNEEIIELPEEECNPAKETSLIHMKVKGNTIKPATKQDGLKYEKLKKESKRKREKWEKELDIIIKNRTIMTESEIKKVYKTLDSENIKINYVMTKKMKDKYIPKKAKDIVDIIHVDPNNLYDSYYFLIKGVLFSIAVNSHCKIVHIDCGNPYFKTPEGIHPGMSLDKAIKESKNGLNIERGWGYYMEYDSGWLAKVSAKNIELSDGTEIDEKYIMNNKNKVNIDFVFRCKLPRRHNNTQYTRNLGF